MADPNPVVPTTDNAPAPQKFSIGGKVLTLEEANKALLDAEAQRAELTSLKSKTGSAEALAESVRKVFNSNDPEAFRSVAKQIGWSQERIDATLNAQALRAAAMRRAQEGDDDDDDDDDEPAPTRRSPAPMTGPDPKIAALEAKIAAWEGATKKMASVMESMAVRDLEANLWPRLEEDKILGQHVKDRGRRAQQLHKVAVEEAKKLFRQSGGAAPEVFEGAVAKARASLEDWGILDESKDSRATSVGQTPSFGLGSTFQPLDNLPKETQMMAPNYKDQLGTLIADAMASGE